MGWEEAPPCLAQVMPPCMVAVLPARPVRCALISLLMKQLTICSAPFPPQLSRLRRLTLWGCQFSSWSGNERGFDPVAACASLEHLGLPGAAFDSLPAQLEHLAPHLTSVVLANMAASPGSWRSLALLTSLRCGGRTP